MYDECYKAMDIIDMIEFLEEEVYGICGIEDGVSLLRIKFEITKMIPWAEDKREVLETALEMLVAHGV